MSRRAHVVVFLAALGLVSAACGPADVSSDVAEVPSALSSPPTPAGTPEAPAADTFVRSGSFTGTAFGGDADVQADRDNAGTVTRGFVRFDLGAYASVTKASLVLFVTNPSRNSADFVVSSSTRWSEGSVTWNQQPPADGATVASVGSSSTGYVTVDVTAAAKAGAQLSLAIMPRSADGFWFASKENVTAAHRPLLYVQGSRQGGDTLPPSVVIDSPALGASLTSPTLAFSATASDNVGVTRVEVYEDAVLKATMTQPPFQTQWALSSADNGSRTLTAKAFDAAGNTGVASVRVTVNVSAALPPPPPPPPPPPAGVVDASTMTGKLIMGYQGWFFCPGDGSPINRWVHWFNSSGHPTVDLWPDTRELPAGERCATTDTLPGGAPAQVYSAYREATVVRHFQWMQTNHLDGVMLQRFTSELVDPAFLAARDQVTRNVRAGAESTGRVFALMYDLSGQNPSTLVATVENDWMHLVDGLQLTQSARYLRHRGRPIVALWGLGFADRPVTPAQATELLNFFHNAPNPAYRATVMGGVPRNWRTLSAWTGVFHALDVVSPWTVGSYVDDAGADSYKPVLAGDLADTAAHGVDFMPVVFPGFSWHNLNAGPLNQIPRRGGTFYWRQVFDAVSAGATMVYGAMFDEVDEGTAMFKVGTTPQDVPTQSPFLYLDIDGQTLPSDWYLRLADQAGRMLRKEIPLSASLPISPP